MISINFFNYHFLSTRLSIHNRFFYSDTSSGSTAFMELLKAVVGRGSASVGRIAVRAQGKSYSYNELVSSSWNVSNVLRNSCRLIDDGVEGNKHLGGARVGIVAKPCAEFVAGVLATWSCGGVAVPLALSYPEAELLHVMNDADVSILLSTDDHQDLMKSIAVKTGAQFSLLSPVVCSNSESGETGDMINVFNSLKNENIEANEVSEDPALILYTSGTTGKPKGVVHTHKSILAQVKTLADAWEYASTDKFLHCLPLHHVHGLFNALLAPLYAGSTVEFMPKFSVSGVWQRWRESYPKDASKANDAVTVFTGVPTIYTRLIQGYEGMDPESRAASASAASHLRLMMCGSSALPLPVMQRWEAITGHQLLERYGMTEFVMAISNPLRGVRKGGTVGKPFPGVQAKILIEETTGDDEKVGELCIRSPSLFKEYWKLLQVTKESFTEDGFFKTGDAVRLDEDGYYIIMGRNNADIMKVGGYKLSALEIEAVLLEHPTISECCVLGLPDKDYGEAICAIVVPDAECKRRREEELKPSLTLEELTSWAKEKLAPYKLPTCLLLWESLPRNAMGKVNKKDLKKKMAVNGW